MDKGQARAFEAFVAESGDWLLQIATLLAHDPHAAEDICQETLQRLAAGWPRIANPKAFCRRIMHNLVIDQARARGRRPREFQLSPSHDSGDPRSADPLAAVELRPALIAALATLTAQQRSIIVLRYFDDRSGAKSPASLASPWAPSRAPPPVPSPSCEPRPGSPPCSPALTPQFDAIPTDATALRAYLIEQATQQAAVALKAEEQQVASLPTPEQKAILDAPQPVQSDDDQVFDQATGMLWNPLVGPALRSALYKVLATTPGVQVDANARDLSGRPAIEISRPDYATGEVTATFEDPGNGSVLESLWDYPGNMGVGTVSYAISGLYLSVTSSSTLPADPYGS